MEIASMIKRQWKAGILAAGIATLPLAASLTAVSADAGPAYQIQSQGAVIGQVNVIGDGAGGAQLTVTLTQARPNTTYVVAACGFDSDMNTFCASDPSQDTVTTDEMGMAQKTLEFSNGIAANFIRLTDTTDASDVGTAYVTNELDSGFGGSMTGQ
jgi:hypothetical protein